MSKIYALLRSKQGEEEWKLTSKGDMEYIFELLKLSLEDPNLQDYEWKVLIAT